MVDAETRLCAHCDEPLDESKKAHARYCDSSCRSLAAKARKAAGYAPASQWDLESASKRVRRHGRLSQRLRENRLKGQAHLRRRGILPPLVAGLLLLVLAASAGAAPVDKGTVTFIAGWESYSARCYNDGGGNRGNATIGVGKLLHLGPCTAADRKLVYTRARAFKEFEADLNANYVPAVDRAQKLAGWVLGPASRTAIVSFTYNLGTGWVNQKPGGPGYTIWREFKQRDRKGVADALRLYINKGTSVEAGLRRRREAERQLWLQDVPKPNKATPDISRVKKPPATAPKGNPKSDNRCVYKLPLSRGARGRDVKVLQLRLRKHGLGLKVTSVYDVATKKSVRTIQRRARLTQDGVAGAKTIAKLELSRCPEPKPSPRALRTTVAMDGAPTYKGLALVWQDIKRNGGAAINLNSGDRRYGVAEKFGRSSQLALWNCWVARRPGCNPANPPGRSTHEQRSDGIAYPGPPGRLLEWWQLGNDIQNSPTALAVGRRLGYCLFRPYSDPREFHHLNFCADPTKRLQQRGLAAR